MKVFFDYQSIFRQKVGGVTRYHYELYNALKAYDDIYAKCQVFGSPNLYFENILGYKPIKNYYGLSGVPYHLNRISNYVQISMGNYDIIHPTWYDPYCFMEKNRGKYVVTIHDMIHELFPGFSENEIEQKKFWIYNSDQIIAVSENTKKDILRLYPDIDENKITVIYHGKNKLPVGKVVANCPQDYILYVGNRGYEYKNFDVVLHALSILKGKKHNLKLICAGGGEIKSSELEKMKKLKIENDVIQMTVTDEELVYLYSNAKCLVCPSTYEGFGFPVLEAFECDCPVISSNTSSLPEVAGDAALYFSPLEVEDLAEKIELILNNSETSELLIQRGKGQRKKFGWEITAKKTKELYDDMIAAR